MLPANHNQLSFQEEKYVRLLQLLGDKTRYQIIKLIYDNQSLCVSEIAHRLGISVSAVSQHFKLLEDNDIVVRLRDGQRICYSLKPSPETTAIITLINKEVS